jgi:hypothetical protein
MNAEEALAKCNDDRNMEDEIGSQLVQLNPVNEEKSPKELVNWDRKAPNEEVCKNYQITSGGFGVASSPRIFIACRSLAGPPS